MEIIDSTQLVVGQRSAQPAGDAEVGDREHLLEAFAQ
jgi:hypothetical protein